MLHRLPLKNVPSMILAESLRCCNAFPGSDDTGNVIDDFTFNGPRRCWRSDPQNDLITLVTTLVQYGPFCAGSEKSTTGCSVSTGNKQQPADGFRCVTNPAGPTTSTLTIETSRTATLVRVRRLMRQMASRVRVNLATICLVR